MQRSAKKLYNADNSISAAAVIGSCRCAVLGFCRYRHLLSSYVHNQYFVPLTASSVIDFCRPAVIGATPLTYPADIGSTPLARTPLSVLRNRPHVLKTLMQLNVGCQDAAGTGVLVDRFNVREALIEKRLQK